MSSENDPFFIVKDCLQPATFIENQKGGKNLMDEDNFVYRKQRALDNESKFRYVCVKHETLKCPAVAVLDIEKCLIVKIRNEHNHSPDLLKMSAR